MLGLSMAGWNALVSLGLSLVSFRAAMFALPGETRFVEPQPAGAPHLKPRDDRLINAEFPCHGMKPRGGALFAEWERRGKVPRPTPFKGGMGAPQERLSEGKDGVRPDAQTAFGGAGGQNRNVFDPQLLQ